VFVPNGLLEGTPSPPRNQGSNHEPIESLGVICFEPAKARYKWMWSLDAELHRQFASLFTSATAQRDVWVRSPPPALPSETLFYEEN
jgi:hypothetical protein